ncbi:hypothetical protein TNCT_532211 [Trichonephila clavata]|uniref:Uncharacterized protein n=1 Tax=Trichonephila clavata TaxID=2740835 RepID=A0A8X6GA95_TRICU|nr:hypothetical protein TNCT_532211 [Trichonephila clavata]
MDLQPPVSQKAYEKIMRKINLASCEVADDSMKNAAKEEILASGSNEICVSGDGKKLNYDDSSIVVHMTLSSPNEFEKFLFIQKISTPGEWISTMRQLIAVTPDNSNRNALENGSSTRWYNQAYGGVNTRIAPIRFQTKGYEQPHQSHMVHFNERKQFNSQPRQVVQHIQHNFRPRRNSENVQEHRWQLLKSTHMNYSNANHENKSNVNGDNGVDQIPDSPEADQENIV